jgi:hypothetical protein
MDWMVVLDRQKPKRYWEVAISRTEMEIIQLRQSLYPMEELPMRYRVVRDTICARAGIPIPGIPTKEEIPSAA